MIFKIIYIIWKHYQKDYMWQLLPIFKVYFRTALYMGYGIDSDELDECERDIVEIAMRKLDVDKDAQITEVDFQRACYMDPLLLQACGPCLPPARSTAAFLALITDKYRNFTQCYHRHWVGADQKGKGVTRRRSSQNLYSRNSGNGMEPTSSLPGKK